MAQGNPNPSPSTRFGAEHGNPSGSSEGGKTTQKRRILTEQLIHDLTINDRVKLRDIVKAQIDKACEGDNVAIAQIFDRVEGKVAQTQIHTGDDEGGPVRVEKTEWLVVKPGSSDPNSGSIPPISGTG